MKIIREILSIGLPSFLQMMGQSITVVFINRILRRYGGDIFISAYGIVNRINVFLLIPCFGLIQGMQPVVGYNHGAGKDGRVDRTVKISALYAGLYGGIIILFLFVFSERLLHIFSNDAMVVENGSYILRIINAGAVFTGIHMVFAAFFQGVGRTGVAMLLSLSNHVLFLLPFILGLAVVMGREGIWISFPLSAIISIIVSFYFYTKQDRSRKRGIQ